MIVILLELGGTPPIVKMCQGNFSTIPPISMALLAGKSELIILSPAMINVYGCDICDII